jgi:DNA-binding MarR family transcriptional regulator
MAAIRLSRLQKRILRRFAADYQRTNGGLASSHHERVVELQHEKGNLSHSLRPLEKRGWIEIGRSPGGKAANMIVTPAGHNEVLKLANVVNKKYRKYKQEPT